MPKIIVKVETLIWMDVPDAVYDPERIGNRFVKNADEEIAASLRLGRQVERKVIVQGGYGRRKHEFSHTKELCG